MGYAFRAVMGAELRSGIDIVLSALRFDEAVRGARLVVTGEGSIDAQTLRGKAPAGVLAAVRPLGIPVVALGGRVDGVEELRAGGFSDVRAITPVGQPSDVAMQRAVAIENMQRAARNLALSLQLGEI
jgi:glycerate kinase